MRIFHFAPPGRSGEAIGLKITTNHLTNMVSPLLFGGFATALGLGPMFWLNGLMMVAGGGITCDTRPEGNTLMNDEAARFGLFDQASPGWDEFEPYQGYDDMFGGNET
jgi:hypothetical protein